jgi:polysaccharide export outer membrane protein
MPFIFLLLLLLGTGPSAPMEEPSAGELVVEVQELPRGYAIGEQDLLEISVFEVDQLSRTVRVDEDGTINLPLLGRVPVSGLTRSELEQEIARRLEDGFVRDPQVTVFIREFHSRRVTVTGAVKNPGSYEMLGPRTLVEMIAEAGGLTDKGAEELHVIRRDPETGEETRLRVSLKKLLYENDSSANLLLAPGDIVYAPFVEMVDIYVNGAVAQPGAYEFRRSDRVTVLQAVTRAGGATARANEKKVQVIRTLAGGRKQILDLDLRKVKKGRAEDIVLQEDDVVVVPESFF